MNTENRTTLSIIQDKLTVYQYMKLNVYKKVEIWGFGHISRKEERFVYCPKIQVNLVLWKA